MRDDILYLEKFFFSLEFSESRRYYIDSYEHLVIPWHFIYTRVNPIIEKIKVLPLD